MTQTETVCKNCHYHFSGKFCNNCGQSADTHRLNSRFVLRYIQKDLLHFDSGLLYTAWELLFRPGVTIRGFIAGKRIAYFSPIPMLALLATLYGFLYYRYHLNHDAAEGTATAISQWISKHFSWATVLTVPLYAVASSVMFRQARFNFFEHFLVNTFQASQRMIVHLAGLPIALYMSGKPGMIYFTSFFFVVDLAMMTRTYQLVFRESITRTIVKSLLSYLLFILLLVMCVLCIYILIDLLTK